MATLRELPYIPLEVGENIIDQLGGHVRSLRSCALTCRGWNRHARYHLVAAICVRSREDLYSIHDYLTSNPRMSRFVRSLSMSPAETEKKSRFLLDVLPVDLLRRLPNLQRYRVVGANWHPLDSIAFHSATFISIKTNLLVEELYLRKLKFCTRAELARVLIALPRLRRLECGTLKVGIKTTDTSRYRDKCKMLTEVTVLHREDEDRYISRLIVQMSLSTLRVLRCNLRQLKDRDELINLSELKHLEFLEIMALQLIKKSFDEIVPIVATLTSNQLRNLTISFREPHDLHTSSDQVGHPLDHAILALGIPSVVVSLPHMKHNKLGVCSRVFRRYFPRLHEDRMLQVQCSYSYPDGEFHLGHSTRVTAMAASPDRRYIATGAQDGSVIVWSGTTAPERIHMEMQGPTESAWVFSLHFSDTSELLAGICGYTLLIWRVVDGVQVTSISGTGHPRSCAWMRQSIDYLTLSVLEWEIHEGPRCAHLSVIKLHVLHSGTVTTSEPVSLLPYHIPAPQIFDNRLISVTRSSSGSLVAAWNRATPGFYVWQMVDSTPTYEMHKLDFGDARSSAFCASFIGDTQLVIGFEDGTIRWWDISSSPLSTVELGVLPLFPEEVQALSVSPLHSFLVAWPQDYKSVFILRCTETRTSQGPLPRPDNFSLHLILRGHTRWVTAVCFSLCERYVATASEDCTVRLWRTRDGELLWTFGDHDCGVSRVAFSPDGRYLTTADNDGRVRIRLLAMFVREVPVSSVDNT